MDQQVRAAFEYTFPLFALATTRYQSIANAHLVGAHGRDVLHHARKLSDPASRWITTPNHDTLYSNAWLNLSRGPVTIRVRQMPAGYYWSLALLDAYTNNFAMLGQRLDAVGPVDVTLIGPEDMVPQGSTRVIKAPGYDVWLFGRFLAEGQDQLDVAHAMQDRVEVGPLGAGCDLPRHVPACATDPTNFLDVVNEVLGRNPPPVPEQGLVQSWQRLGIRPGVSGAWGDLTSDLQHTWSRGIASWHADLHRQPATQRQEAHGWLTAGPQTGRFGTNYRLRACVALTGLGGLEPIEAMYFFRNLDDAGEILDGREHYRLKVPAGGIPTNSFWSISLYEPTVDGRRFFVLNPIGRYAIGDRTPGLAREPDGSLEIHIQHVAPSTEAGRSNWLPSPAGTFRLMLRAYLPRPELLALQAPMPGLTRIGP